jgi:hypothetical protein
MSFILRNIARYAAQKPASDPRVRESASKAARLESAAEAGSILLAHETNSLVTDIVLTEEQPPMTVKGFVRPINNYKVVGTYDELVDQGRVVLQERDGLKVLIDLTKQDKSEAIAVLEEVLSQLKN